MNNPRKRKSSVLRGSERKKIKRSKKQDSKNDKKAKEKAKRQRKKAAHQSRKEARKQRRAEASAESAEASAGSSGSSGTAGEAVPSDCSGNAGEAVKPGSGSGSGSSGSGSGSSSAAKAKAAEEPEGSTGWDSSLDDSGDSEGGAEPLGQQPQAAEKQRVALARSKKAQGSMHRRADERSRAGRPLVRAHKHFGVQGSTQGNMRSKQQPTGRPAGTAQLNNGYWSAQISAGTGPNNRSYIGIFENKELASAAYQAEKSKAPSSNTPATLSKVPAQGFLKFSHNVGDGRSNRGAVTKCYFYWKRNAGQVLVKVKCPVCGSEKKRKCREEAD
jgi:hypothetical protein